jgi:nucleotide-binding universal stress UspA family protein
VLETILVPLDGSALAASALPWASAIARAVRGRVVLVRSVYAQDFPLGSAGRIPIGPMAEVASDLARAAERLRAEGLAVESFTIPDAHEYYDEAAEPILAACRASRADLLVMAIHGRAGFGRWARGSVVEGLLGRSPVPVLAVRAGREPPHGAALGDSPRLLVPLDGSARAEAALPVALELCAALDGQLVLLRSLAPGHPARSEERDVEATHADTGRESDAREKAARAYLIRVGRGLAAESPTRRPRFEVRAGQPAESILAASREHAAALVVMATRGRTGLGRLILGSVADRVLRQGSAPLLLVGPAAGIFPTVGATGAWPPPSPASGTP